MSQNLVFGYFNFQGRGQISRLLLAYTKTLYEQKVYSFSKLEDWTHDKQTLSFNFPNLPYLIDKGFKLTQSKAIQRYIIHRAKRTDMLGKNSKQKAIIDNIEGVIRDIFTNISTLIFAQDINETRKKVYQTLQPKLNYIHQFIGTKNHLLNRITYPDFILTIAYAYFRFFFPHQFHKWHNIQRIFQYVNNLPQIKSYYSSSGSISDLIMPQQANNQRFLNFKSIFEIQNTQKQSVSLPQKVEEIRPQPVMVQIKQPVTQNESKNLQTIQVNQILKQLARQQQTFKQMNIKKTESIVSQPKYFNTRVQNFLKAVQATNQKGSSQNIQSLQKSTIVTPSKLGSSIKNSGNTNASWKIQDQAQKTQTNIIQNSKICLGYWGIRGLGQVQRHLLTYCGHQFTQKLYRTRQQWFNGDKLTLNLPFPNLPYLVSGNLKLTQSLSIDRYIIRTSNKKELLGKNLKDETYIENFVKILSDLFAEIRVQCFVQEDPKKKAQIIEKLENNFAKFQSFVNGKDYTFGYLTWPDFYISEISYYIERMYPQVYEKYSFLKRVRQSISNCEQIKKYYERTDGVKGPFMPPSARISF